MNRVVRVIVADSSRTSRRVLVQALREDPAIQVVAEAADGRDAVDLVERLRPDLVTMDVLMPGLDGISTIRAIMSIAPARIVVVSSPASDREGDLGMRAISAGAVEVLNKPLSSADLPAWSARLRESVRLMAAVPVIRRTYRGSYPDARTPVLAARVPLAAFALGASTGGPAALAELLAALPSTLPVPVFVAQHMATGFVRGLVRWFAAECPLRVVVVDRRVPATPGHVYLPTDGHDLIADTDGFLRAETTDEEPRPSVDRLFESLSRAYGARGGAGLLTGMGEDGARGLLAIRRAGGPTLCQDEATSVVFGMPEAALRLGAVDRPLPLAAMAPAIASLCNAKPCT